MSTNSFQELQARYIAGEQLSSEEATGLLRLLRESPESRRDLLIDQSIDNQLRCMARLDNKESADSFIHETVQRAVALRHSQTSHDTVRIRESNESGRIRPFSIPLGISAAALVLISFAVIRYATRKPQHHDFGFAQITSTEDLSWELVDVDSRRLRVSTGIGQVQFENGTIAELVAPAVVELRTPDKLFVKSGSVKINVSPAAVGFTVETPIARIVDLGTKLDVDVGEAGQTQARVRSGIVTFETHSMSHLRSSPIKLTAEGLNHASAEVSELTTDVQSVATTASGAEGQFFGTIHADGETVEFETREEFDSFLSRLNASLEKNPSQFHEQWKVIEKTTANSTSTMVESSGGSGIMRGAPVGQRRPAGAHEMMLEQLQLMQERHQGNAQMQELLDGMINQVKEDGKNAGDR